MFLFEYIVKLLLGNSNTLFAGLLIVIFSYYGWLLWNINDRMIKSVQIWEKHDDNLNGLRDKINKLDEDVYRDFLDKLNKNLVYLKTIDSQLENGESEMDKFKSEIIAEIKEENNETKELMKIMLGRRIRNNYVEVTDANPDQEITENQEKDSCNDQSE